VNSIARLIQPQRFHLDDAFLVLQLLVFALPARRQPSLSEARWNVLFLQTAQLCVVVGDFLVKVSTHLRLQLGLDGRKRHWFFSELVVVEESDSAAASAGILFLALGVAARPGAAAERGRDARRRGAGTM